MNSKQSLFFSSILLASLIALVVPAAQAKTDPNVASPQFLVGAFPSPPMGAGPGKLAEIVLPDGTAQVVHFGKADTLAGNSFYVGVDTRNQQLFVPSVAGTTDVIDLATHKLMRQFKSIPGGRVAMLSPDRSMVFILSGKALGAYSTSDGTLRYQVPVGGNAMVFNTDGSHLYVGGNMHKTIADINPSNGHIEHQIPIGHSGDLAWANGKLFSADIKSGVMSAYNPETDHIYNIETNEVDPNFAYNKILMAKAGFMQLSVSPSQDSVYAAGFSGHILRFSTTEPSYLGQINITAGKAGPNKLSGLAVLPNSDKAITTVENRHESVIVDLKNGKILKRLPNIVSNRWVAAL